MNIKKCSLLALLCLAASFAGASQADVRIKDLARFDGVRENVAVGYGLVVGLSGTGDSRRSFATVESVSNVLREFGLQVPPAAVNSRNVAAVLVTTNLPGFLRPGDRLDVNVSSIGDASSLAGGTLLMTPILGPDRSVYAVAQGPLSIGGFRFEQNGTVRQKNHPTSGIIPEGAIAEQAISPQLLSSEGTLDLILNEPDFTTANRVAAAINTSVRGISATAVEAGRVRLQPPGTSKGEVVAMIAAVENLTIEPDSRARVVVNERTGTIVSGGQVSISAVTVSQGDIRVSIDTRFLVSQPDNLSLVRSNPTIQTTIVPETEMKVDEAAVQSVNLPDGATIGDLVRALRGIRASSRDVIAILQGIKRAGALHAELIIQ
jgi:flagellar P-ring protein precursor FlgI